MCVYRTSENCKSLILQDNCSLEIFLSPVPLSINNILACGKQLLALYSFFKSFIQLYSARHSILESFFPSR